MLKKIISAIQSQKPDKGGGAKSWWRWPVLVMLVLFGVAVAVWITRSNARELAQLRHEKFKRAELTKQAETDSVIATNVVARNRALAEVKKQMEKLLEAELRLHVAEKKYETNRKDIQRITWADLPRGD